MICMAIGYSFRDGGVTRYLMASMKVTVDGIDELLEKIRLQISVVPT